VLGRTSMMSDFTCRPKNNTGGELSESPAISLLYHSKHPPLLHLL
jgi:hypothetical protein